MIEFPSAARVVTLRSETKDERSDRVAKAWKAFRAKPGSPTPFDQFKVTNANLLEYREKDAPRLLYWVDSDRWLEVRMPHLSMHRTVAEPAVTDREGNVTRPARTRRKLSLPHYEDPTAKVELSGIHWKDAVAAALGLIPQERAYRRVEQHRQARYALQAALYVLADEKTEVSAREIFTLLDRERFPITPEEALEEVARTRGGKDEDEDKEVPEASEPRGSRPPPARAESEDPD